MFCFAAIICGMTAFGSGLNDLSDALGTARVRILAEFVQGDLSSHHVDHYSNAFDAFLEGIGNINLRNLREQGTER